ncbi:MAG: SMP-30/gluconolactonase/LRE family protein [Pirellulales bacterium]
MSRLCSIVCLCLGTWATVSQAADGFRPTPDHEVQPGVPQGKVHAMPAWKSEVFPQTIRDWWVYVPAQYRADQPAAVMVFQDGHDYVALQGNWRVPTVFDNLIHRGEMPVTLAVFINPGHDVQRGETYRTVKWQASNRSFEYDSLGDRYARFLITEILPELRKQWNIADDPEQRAICGASSGGICSFTVAWERPDQFRKVLSTIGSFVNLRGGDVYPSLIRKTERLPLRVYLEDTSGDLDNKFGNWPLANQEMDRALRYLGYDTRFDYTTGYAHNSQHGGSVFPEALRWLWRREAHQPVISTKQDLGGDLTLLKLLVPDESWQVVAEGLEFADGPCSDAAGNFYYSDLRANQIWRIALDGTRTKILDAGASGLKFGPDGRLYACQPKEQRVVAFDLAKGGEMTVLAANVQPNDLVVTRRGHVYFTQTGKQEVTFVDPAAGQTRAVDQGITAPNGITLSPDQGTLAVSDYRGGHTWLFQLAADGSLTGKSPTITLRRPIDPKGEFKFNEPPPRLAASGGDGMASDEQGRFYVATTLGIQVFDAGGRECGLLPKLLLPAECQPKPLTSCVLAGADRSYLYITVGDRILRRRVQARGSDFTSAP